MLAVGMLQTCAAIMAKDPQFCIITPTAYLERYAALSSMHLVLAHLVDTDEAYANFYAGRSEFKIMDNGAFELGESYEPDKLIELGQKCNADAIVLPDYPFQSAQKTVDASTALIDPVKDAGFKTLLKTRLTLTPPKYKQKKGKGKKLLLNLMDLFKKPSSTN